MFELLLYVVRLLFEAIGFIVSIFIVLAILGWLVERFCDWWRKFINERWKE